MNNKLVGIYCYMDTLNNNEIVYVGKDSNIHNQQRRRDHLAKSRYNDQPFNRTLQNNPGRYQYKVLKSWQKRDYSNSLINFLEVIYIRRYNPKFNYTLGGDGRLGSKLSDEHKEKISKAHKGKIVSKETRAKLSKAMKGKPGPNKGKKFSQETKDKLSKARKGKNTGKDNPNYSDNVPNPQALYEEWKSGMTYTELSIKYDCGTATIQRRINKVRKKDARYNHNTPSKDVLFNEWQNGLTQKELSEKYNCSVSHIETKIRKYKKENDITNVKTNHGKHHPLLRSDIPNGEGLLEEINKYDLSFKQLAEKYNCSESLINHRIRKTRNKIILPHYKNVPNGQELLKEYETSNHTQRELAEKYNCSVDCIKNRIRSARRKLV